MEQKTGLRAMCRRSQGGDEDSLLGFGLHCYSRADYDCSESFIHPSMYQL